MTSNGRDPRQIETIVKVHELNRDKVKNQIFQLNDAIKKKESSIAMFQDYALHYSQNDSSALKNIQTIKNSHAFYQNLERVIQAEKSDLDRMHKIKKELVAAFTGLANKITGLTAIYNEIKGEETAALAKMEEHDMFDLSVIRKRTGSPWSL